MTVDITEITLKVKPTAQDDDAEIERIAGQLREELLNMDVQKVSPVKRDYLEPGAKSGEATILGEMVVGISIKLLPALIGLLQSWLDRRNRQGVGGGSITLRDNDREVEFPANPSDYQKRLIEDWLRPHRR